MKTTITSHHTMRIIIICALCIINFSLNKNFAMVNETAERVKHDHQDEKNSSPALSLASSARLPHSSSSVTSTTVGKEGTTGTKATNENKSLLTLENDQKPSPPGGGDSAIGAALTNNDIREVLKTRNLLRPSKNSSHYTWTGNHFIPPKGVPTFSPPDYLSYFQKRNILFIGDSTGRRAYATLFAILSSADYSNVKVKAIDHDNVIDVNKKGERKTNTCDLRERRLLGMDFNQYSGGGHNQFLCRNTTFMSPHYTQQQNRSMSDEQNHNKTKSMFLRAAFSPSEGEGNQHLQETTTSSREGAPKGKFDFINSVCISDLIEIFTNKTKVQALKDDYDLVVISAGVWEAKATYYCKMISNEVPVNLVPFMKTNLTNNEGNKPRRVTVTEKLDMFVDALTNVTYPNLQIAFRTPGFDQDHAGDDAVWEIINRFKNIAWEQRTFVAADKTSSTNDADINHDIGYGNKKGGNLLHNLTIVDWGTVIEKRSFGKERISADMKVHYGLEARLLFAQQLLHELVSASDQ